MQNIEDIIFQFSFAGALVILQKLETRYAFFIRYDHFAVEDGIVIKFFQLLGDRSEALIEGNKIAAVEIDISVSRNISNGAVAVEFYFEYPARIVEWLIRKFGKHGFKPRERFFS